MGVLQGPRYAGRKGGRMTREEAHFILDCARAGVDVGDDLINIALLVTGDWNGWAA